MKLVDRVFDALCVHPYGLTMGELIPLVYLDPNREPEHPEWVLPAVICHANKKWRTAGELIQIRGSGGPGSKYQIWIKRPNGVAKS